MNNNININQKRSENNFNLHEKRLGLYVLMGSIIYILTIKNRNEKGLLDMSYSWLLILFRAGPLGGIILMIPYMISNLKLQVNNLCETVKLYHVKYNKKESMAIARDLFPYLDEQFSMVEILRKYIVRGLFYYSIGESLSEISIQYNEDSSILLLFIPYISSIIRSIGTIMYCIGLLKDIPRVKNFEYLKSIITSLIIVISYYFIIKYILKYLIFYGNVLLTESLLGRVLYLRVFVLFIYVELILQILLLSITILRRRNNKYASNASKISSIIGSLFITTSIILRCFHIDKIKLPYFIPYFEIGPLIWGSFILGHSIAFYIRYEDIAYSQEWRIGSFERKTQ